MSSLYDRNAPKKPTNLTINSDLLTQVRVYQVNLSATLESALVEILKAKKAGLWKEENKEAIASYNKSMKESGLFSDDARMF